MKVNVKPYKVDSHEMFVSFPINCTNYFRFFEKNKYLYYLIFFQASRFWMTAPSRFFWRIKNSYLGTDTDSNQNWRKDQRLILISLGMFCFSWPNSYDDVTKNSINNKNTLHNLIENSFQPFSQSFKTVIVNWIWQQSLTSSTFKNASENFSWELPQHSHGINDVHHIHIFFVLQ